MEKVTYTVVSTALRNGPTSGIVVVEFHIETPTLLGRVPAKKLWMSERENNERKGEWANGTAWEYEDKSDR